MKVQTINPRFDKSKYYHLTTIDRVGQIKSQGLLTSRATTNPTGGYYASRCYLTNDPIQLLEKDTNFLYLKDNDIVIFEVDKKGFTSLERDEEYDVGEDGQPFAFLTYESIKPEYLVCLGKIEVTYDKVEGGIKITSWKLFDNIGY